MCIRDSITAVKNGQQFFDVAIARSLGERNADRLRIDHANVELAFARGPENGFQRTVAELDAQRIEERLVREIESELVKSCRQTQRACPHAAGNARQSLW